MMKKKDYELIAEAIKDVGLFYHVGRDFPHLGAESVLRSVAMELARHNRRVHSPSHAVVKPIDVNLQPPDRRRLHDHPGQSAHRTAVSNSTGSIRTLPSAN